MDIVVVVLAFAVATVLVALIGRSTGVSMSRRMGSPRWELDSSWASTLTGAAAVVGVVLAQSSSVLPKPTVLLSTGAYTSLSLFFGALLPMSALVYNALRTKERPTDEAEVKRIQYQGTVGTFLMASALLIWAVYGQIVTLGLLVYEIDRQHALSGVIEGIALLGLLLIAVWIIPKYTEQSIVMALDTGDPDAALVRAKFRAAALHGGAAPKIDRAVLPDWSMF